MNETTESRSLGELLPLELERCRELLIDYDKIGPAGSFGSLMIRDALKRADAAVMAGDVVAMLRIYEELKKFE